MGPGVILLALVGVWLITQATAGDLAGRLLSWRSTPIGGSAAAGVDLDQAVDVGRATATGAATAAGRTESGVRLASWGGATLAAHVMPSFRAMVEAAAADGVILRPGSTYRSRAQQIELRKAHCGTSHYDIYEKPAGSCRPPTARPGSSRHERGEAVDFQHMTSRSSAGFIWLSQNAARFGWFNLPSEPWHWSRDGH